MSLPKRIYKIRFPMYGIWWLQTDFGRTYGGRIKPQVYQIPVYDSVEKGMNYYFTKENNDITVHLTNAAGVTRSTKVVKDHVSTEYMTDKMMTRLLTWGITKM